MQDNSKSLRTDLDDIFMISRLWAWYKSFSILCPVV